MLAATGLSQMEARLDALAKQARVCRRPSNEAMLRCLATTRAQDDPRKSGTNLWITSAERSSREVWGASGTGGEALKAQRKSRATSAIPVNYNPERGGPPPTAHWDSFTQEWVQVEDWQRALDYRELCR